MMGQAKKMSKKVTDIAVKLCCWIDGEVNQRDLQTLKTYIHAGMMMMKE